MAATAVLVALTATACSTQNRSADSGTPAPTSWSPAAPQSPTPCAARAVHAGVWKAKPVDFNGDGWPDLAIGAPPANIGRHQQAGYVSVVYGKAGGGLDLAHHATYDEDTPGIAGDASTDGRFTESLATDIDGDGYTDLVVGGRDRLYTWTSTILWGGPGGLHAPTVLRAAPTGATSAILATSGDFDGDGRTDLVAGNTILYGVGRDGRPSRVGRIPSHLEGAATTAAGDVNGDGITDLVTLDGMSDDDAQEYTAYLFLGGADGPTPAGVLKNAFGHDLTGQTAAIGDLNGDGCGDIVVGQRGDSEYDGKIPQGGGLGIVYGGAAGASAQRPVWISQSTPGIDQHGLDGDDLGTSVAVADLDGDGCADILTGIPGRAHDGVRGAGSVLVLHGSARGVSGQGAQLWDQGSAGVPGDYARNGGFGTDVTVLGGPAPASGTRIAVSGGAGGLVSLMRTGSHGPTTSGMTAFGPAAIGAPAAPAGFGFVLNDTVATE